MHIKLFAVVYIGYICPQNTINPYLIECGSSSLYCPIGTYNAKTVPDGYYSFGGINEKTHTNYTQCEIGNYCINGKMIPCQPGSYNNITKQSSCELCLSGSYSISYNNTLCI